MIIDSKIGKKADLTDRLEPAEAGLKNNGRAPNRKLAFTINQEDYISKLEKVALMVKDTKKEEF